MCGRYRPNSNGKLGFFDHIEIEECVLRPSHQPQATGNNDMAVKTESIYISGTITDSIEIPRTNTDVLTMTSSARVSASDCVNDGQPEIIARL